MSSSLHDPAWAGKLAFAPAEIRRLIYQFAMTANGGQFCFHDQTEAYAPNVATGLLRVNHALYHEARGYLYSQNTFVFTRCGSDLRIIFQPRKTSESGDAGSSARVQVPSFNRVIFDLGDNQNPEMGRFKTRSFMAALNGLRDDVYIDHLILRLGHDSWELGDSEPHDFGKALRKMKIKKSFEMLGMDTYLLHDIRAIPRALSMNIQPIWSKLYPCDMGLGARGVFTSIYVPAETPEETGLQAGQILIDAGVEYYARLMHPDLYGI